MGFQEMFYTVSTLKWFSGPLRGRVLHWPEAFHRMHRVMMAQPINDAVAEKMEWSTRAKFSQVCFHGEACYKRLLNWYLFSFLPSFLCVILDNLVHLTSPDFFFELFYKLVFIWWDHYFPSCTWQNFWESMAGRKLGEILQHPVSFWFTLRSSPVSIMVFLTRFHVNNGLSG